MGLERELTTGGVGVGGGGQRSVPELNTLNGLSKIRWGGWSCGGWGELSSRTGSDSCRTR